MLNSIRKFAKGPFGWVILLVLAIPFLFFGVQGYFINASEKTVIRIGDEKISNIQFDNIWQTRLNQLRSQNLSDQQLNSYRVNLLSSLIYRLSIENHLNKQGFVIVDQSVGKQISSDQMFYENGQFSKQLYLRLLEQNQLSIEDYENNLKEQLRFEQFSLFLENALFATNFEFNQLNKLINQKRSGGFAIYDSADLAQTITVLDEEIKNHYEDNKSTYMQNSQVQIQYVLIDKDNLAKPIVDNQAIVNYYQNFEKRLVREIFISNQDSDSINKKQLAYDILQEIKLNPVSFDVYLEQSDDPKAAENKGSLGLIERGSLGENFDQVLFDLAVDEAGLVESEVGYHILLVDQIINYQSKPLEQVKNEIKAVLENEKLNQDYQNLIAQAKTINYDYFDNLDKLSQDLNLDIQLTDFFDQSANNLAQFLNNSELLKQAFSEKIQSGSNSSLIELSDGLAVIFRQNDFKPARQKTLQEASEQISEQIKTKKAIAQIQSELNEKVNNLKQNSVDSQNYSSYFSNWQKIDNLASQQAFNNNINNEIISLFFDMPATKDNQINWIVADLSNNKVAAIALTAVELKDIDSDLTDAKNLFDQYINSLIFNLLVNTLIDEDDYFIDEEFFFDPS